MDAFEFFEDVIFDYFYDLSEDEIEDYFFNVD